MAELQGDGRGFGVPPQQVSRAVAPEHAAHAPPQGIPGVIRAGFSLGEACPAWQ